MNDRRVSVARFLVTLVLVLSGVLAIGSVASRYVATPWEIVGASMEPTLRAGDRVIVDLVSYRKRLPRTGEIALLERPDGETWVKRVRAGPVGIVETDGARFEIAGDNIADSADSRAIGELPASAFRGRVAWRYWPPSRFGPIR